MFIKKVLLAAFVVCFVFCGLGFCADKAKAPLTVSEKLDLIRSVSDSQVKVEYHLKTDKGETPSIEGAARLCPGCGQYHPVDIGEGVIEEERPVEVPGFMIGTNLVQVVDVMVHPRFLEKIQVRFKDSVVDAKVKSYIKDSFSMVLELAAPLAGVKPLVLDASKKGPYYIISHDKLNGTWSSSISPTAGKITVNEVGQSFLYPGIDGIAVTKNGVAVGLILSSELPLDGSWKGPIKDSEVMSVDQMKAFCAKIQAVADKSILRVKIKLRSPKKGGSGRSRYFDDDEDGANKTELDTLAVITGKKQALVLANMTQKVTARVERITLYTETGAAIKAKFVGTLSDYGALVVELEKELDAAVKFAEKDVLKYRKSMLGNVSIKVRGNKRIAYYKRGRITGYATGWRNQVYPQVPEGFEERSNRFLFDENGELVAIPIARRVKVQEDMWYGDSDKPLTSVAYIGGVLGDLAKNVDKSNVPLSKEEESRLAWLGIEIQALSKELARMNNVSEQTKDGQTGGLVSYVYADSPASKAGIEPGMVILRLNVEGRKKPIEVNVRDDMGFMGEFPWDQLEMIPAEYLDNIPRPWGTMENTFIRALTDIGFGKKFVAEFSNNGKAFNKEFTVVESPAHYDSAKHYKSADLGLTVRNMTYEVRRYFQKMPDDPGVIVSKIDPGKKAAVSGIKPYEIVTQINGTVVKNVEDFEKLIKDQQELRISVKRKMKGRVVKIKIER